MLILIGEAAVARWARRRPSAGRPEVPLSVEWAGLSRSAALRLVSISRPAAYNVALNQRRNRGMELMTLNWGDWSIVVAFLVVRRVRNT